MSTYAWLLLAIGLPPLVAALAHWRFGWARHEWRRYGALAVFVSLPWTIVDALSHARGWWSYAPEHVGRLTFLGLPIEEISFFFVVPFACLFLYTSLQRLLPKRRLDRRLVTIGVAIVAVVAILVALVSWRERTIVDAVLCLAVLAAAYLHQHWTRADAVWWLSVIVLFFVCNSVLTALPIVTYDHAYGSWLKIGTIPVEDFLYNISLLGCAWLVWQYCERPIRR